MAVSEKSRLYLEGTICTGKWNRELPGTKSESSQVEPYDSVETRLSITCDPLSTLLFSCPHSTFIILFFGIVTGPLPTLATWEPLSGFCFFRTDKKGLDVLCPSSSAEHSLCTLWSEKILSSDASLCASSSVTLNPMKMFRVTASNQNWHQGRFITHTRNNIFGQGEFNSPSIQFIALPAWAAPPPLWQLSFLVRSHSWHLWTRVP